MHYGVDSSRYVPPEAAAMRRMTLDADGSSGKKPPPPIRNPPKCMPLQKDPAVNVVV